MHFSLSIFYCSTIIKESQSQQYLRIRRNKFLYKDIETDIKTLYLVSQSSKKCNYPVWYFSLDSLKANLPIIISLDSLLYTSFPLLACLSAKVDSLLFCEKKKNLFSHYYMFNEVLRWEISYYFLRNVNERIYMYIYLERVTGKVKEITVI